MRPGLVPRNVAPQRDPLFGEAAMLSLPILELLHDSRDPPLTGDQEEQETLPLFQAVERGNLRAVEKYLAEGGAVEARNRRGQTLLSAAALYSWPKIVRLLLEHSADPNARDRRGRAPLHHAATHSIDSVKLLLTAGADAKARDNKGKSVLAAWSYRADQILRAHGAEE